MRFNDPRRRAAQAARQALGQDQPRTTQDFINQLQATQGQEPWRIRQVPDGGVFGAINPYQPTGNISLDNRPAPAAAPTQPARQAPPPRRPGTIHNSVEQASQEYRDWRDSLPGIEGARVRLADWAYGKEQSGLQDFAGEVLAAPFRMAGRYHAGDFKGAGIDLGAEALGAMAGAFIPGGGAVVRAGSRAAKGAAKEAAEGAARGALRGADEELANIARLQREIAQINREIGQRNPSLNYEGEIERIMAGRPMSELSPRELQQVIDLDNRNLGALDAIERSSPFPGTTAMGFREVRPEQFAEALEDFKRARPNEAGFITNRTPDEMRQEGMRTFLSPDGRTGYAIHPETGDIRNVFNFGAGGGGARAVADALAGEGRILDAFDTNLGNFYRDFGFRETERLKWDPQYAPSQWNAEKYGTPDVVMMQHPTAGRMSAQEYLDLYNRNREMRKAAASAPSGPQVTVRDPRRLSTREGSGWTDGYTTVEYDVGPDGPVRVMYKNPSEDGVLRIENIDTPALDDFTGRIGPGAIRRILRDLQESTGARRITAERVSGANPNRELSIDLPKTPNVRVAERAPGAGRGGDNLGFPGGNPRRTGLVREQDVIPGTPVAGTPADAPLQHDLARHVGPRIPGQRVQDAEDMAFDAMTGPIWRDLTERGLELSPDPWYHTPRTRQRALDALGDEGDDAYLRMMQMMAAVTARSQPPNNLRRAQYYYGLDRAGLLFPDLLDAGAYKRVPTGYGHLAQGAHHAGIRRLLTEGGINSVANPKPAGFGENLLGNMRPYTMDSRIGQALLAIEPRLEGVGALRRTVQEGIDTASPTNWGYAPLERAGQRAAELFQQQGLLDVPSGIAPTARAQELPWIALSEVLPDAPPNLGTFDEIFDMFADETARRWGVDPITANRLIWEGHPALLPLNARSNPVPRDIWRELGIIR